MIKKHSGIYTLEVEQFLKSDIDYTWNFFLDPQNLSKITPEHMGFQITSSKPDKMHEGQIITYKIGVLPFITSNWVTEITHIKDKEYFVDEQRLGPYKMWHHQHFFYEKKDGVLMKDKVSFALPFGLFGEAAYLLFVKKELKKIFNYRFVKLEQIFK